MNVREAVIKIYKDFGKQCNVDMFDYETAGAIYMIYHDKRSSCKYIGQTKKSIATRMKKHLTSAKILTKPLPELPTGLQAVHICLVKYDMDKFNVIRLQRLEPEDFVKQKGESYNKATLAEKLWIDALHTRMHAGLNVHPVYNKKKNDAKKIFYHKASYNYRYVEHQLSQDKIYENRFPGENKKYINALADEIKTNKKITEQEIRRGLTDLKRVWEVCVNTNDPSNSIDCTSFFSRKPKARIILYLTLIQKFLKRVDEIFTKFTLDDTNLVASYANRRKTLKYILVQAFVNYDFHCRIMCRPHFTFDYCASFQFVGADTFFIKSFKYLTQCLTQNNTDMSNNFVPPMIYFNYATSVGPQLFNNFIESDKEDNLDKLSKSSCMCQFFLVKYKHGKNKHVYTTDCSMIKAILANCT